MIEETPKMIKEKNKKSNKLEKELLKKQKQLEKENKKAIKENLKKQKQEEIEKTTQIKEIDLLIYKNKTITYEDHINDTNKLINESLINQLQKISDDPELPHVIFYGNEGSGKKTIINMFLNMIYGDEIYNLRKRIFKVPGSGGKTKEIEVLESVNHIIIKPNKNNFDRYMIQKIVNDYTFFAPLYIYKEKKDFKTIQIDNLDNLSFTAQACLRRIIEKHSKNYRFIFWCRSLTKISEPLRSRCLIIHVPYYSNEKLLLWSNNICIKYNRIIEQNMLKKIIIKSNGNLKNILLGIDLYYYKKKIETSYDNNINVICNILLSNNLNIRKLRDIVYELTNKAPYLKVFKDITLNLFDKIKNENIKNIIVNEATNYEFELTKARREMIHIESYFNFLHETIKSY